mmetsp:Transcript_7478/g.27457  ORF Transcript_7478/g.27457 Transcript_7478/m.27457 type:complete len:594 (-) Transcript_7478:3315-5096(-)
MEHRSANSRAEFRHGAPGGRHAQHRVIVHLDLDCFYAQVEHRRLKVPREVPLAVQQWDGLIAINYVARKAGVSRGMRVGEAKQACPNLVCVHVETISNIAPAPSEAQQEQVGIAAGHTRANSKASLERYRRASTEVFEILQRFSSVVEKASIDEAYVDLTGAVDEKYAGGQQWSSRYDSPISSETEAAQARPTCLDGVLPPTLEGTEVIGKLDSTSVLDARLGQAAEIVSRMRAAIFQETGFTISAGISNNKMLAKLASASHKPNKQTLVPWAGASSLLRTLPLRSIRGLGGKLGSQLEALFPQAQSAVDLQDVPLSAFEHHFDPKTAQWLYHVCRGIDDDPVAPNIKAKSLLAFKSFEAVPSLSQAQPWLSLLATELVGRMEEDFRTHNRKARSLTVHFRSTLRADHRSNWIAGRTSELTNTHSRTCSMPQGIGDLPTPSAIVQAAKITLQSSAAVAFPCTRIALGASDFVDIPRGVAPITSYFCRADVQHEGETDVQAKLSSAAPSGATTELEEGKAEAQVEEDDVVNGARDNSFVDLASFSIIEQQRIMRDVEKRRNSTNGVADSLAGCKKRKQQDRGQRGIRSYFSKNV